ncbi:MAG: lysine--tRNA ligase, partial [Candidatus Neomarinimicrobiota bacterium]
MSDDQKSLMQIINYRKEKLAKLISAGINPYPHNYTVTHYSNDILDNFKNMEGKTVNIAGRIMALRKMGKASFFHVQDKSGRIQVFIKRDDVGEENYAHFKLLDLGDYIGIKGYIFKTKTEEISIHAQVLTVLAKSIRPLPVVKEKEGTVYDAFADKEQRYRNRHLDLIVNTEIRITFVQRARIISAIRKYFDDQDFIEVETPVLQPLYGGANARPFTTYHNALDQKLYLRIADELYLKRLIIGGLEKVYELSKDFRNEGMDRSHNPEFTMLEWYEAYTDYNDQMGRVESIFKICAQTLKKFKFDSSGVEIDISKPFARIPYFELLKKATGKDLSSADEIDLKTISKQNKIEYGDGANYGQLMDGLMSALVEPKLIQPTFIVDYPKIISPLAKSHRNGDPNLVERFELFIGGAEFANSFTELNDPIDQRARLEAQARLALDGDEEAQPVDEDFLRAVECGMPPTGGVGLGIDRLVMLFTENRWIKDVILFPALRREE